MSLNHSPRIAPLSPPYEPDIATALAKWIPPGSALEPLKLFRTLYQNPQLTSRTQSLCNRNN
jgi:4-carboxymuconolactone decarboxylase